MVWEKNLRLALGTDAYTLYLRQTLYILSPFCILSRLFLKFSKVLTRRICSVCFDQPWYYLVLSLVKFAWFSFYAEINWMLFISYFFSFWELCGLLCESVSLVLTNSTCVQLALGFCCQENPSQMISTWFILYRYLKPTGGGSSLVVFALDILIIFVSDFGFWTQMSDFEFWTLESDFGFWTLMSEFGYLDSGS